MKVKRITTLPGLHDVYDLEVPMHHNFCVNGGLVVHNCRYALDLDIKTHYTPKQWTLPKAYQRKYASED